MHPTAATQQPAAHLSLPAPAACTPRPLFSSPLPPPQSTPQDPKFTRLHYLALLGHGTLSEALASSCPETHRRFARLARSLVEKHEHSVFVVDKVRL